VPVDIVPATADDLPVIDHSIDAVVSTLVLCSVDDLPAVLAELRRVLVPGGRLAFVEHIRGGTVRGRIQDLATPLWRHFGGGCRPNRAIVDVIRAAGFAIDDVEIFKPSPNVFVTSPLAQGVATLAR
jgi:SAM-dependent methyltransferase